DSEVLPLPLPPNDSKLQIPPAIAKKISAASEVQLHNPSGFGSMYLMPYSISGLKQSNVKSDCLDAASEGRNPGTGCSKLNVRGMETLTLLYDQTAARCNEVAELQRKGRELSAQERTLLAESI